MHIDRQTQLRMTKIIMKYPVNVEISDCQLLLMAPKRIQSTHITEISIFLRSYRPINYSKAESTTLWILPSLPSALLSW